MTACKVIGNIGRRDHLRAKIKNLEKILTLHYAMVLLRAGRKEGDLMLTDGGGEMLYMILICYVMMMYC